MNPRVATGLRKIGQSGTCRRRRGAVAAFLSLIASVVIVGAAGAQDGARQGYVERVQPDLQIVVIPLPTGEWGISSVYPAREPHADAERRLQRLLSQTKWKANQVEYIDSSLDLKRRDGKPIDRTTAADKDAPADPVMSEVTFATPANVVDLQGGTIDVAPFALANEDLTHVNIVFFIPAKYQFTFRGLRHFDDPHLSLDMASGQGTYTYVMNIKDHRMSALDLPKYEPIVKAQSPNLRALQTRARTLQTALVIALAGIVGCIVYLWATKLIGGNSSSSRG